MKDLQVIELRLTENRLLRLDDINAVKHQLINGRIVVLPTETGYLLGVDALNTDAIEKVYRIKARTLSNPIHVVVSGLEMAENLVFLDALSRRLCCRLMPGPLTVICPKRPVVSDLLVANTGNLGIRIPDSPVLLQVVQAFGKPITATSLNLSGASGTESVEDTIEGLNWEGERLVHLVKDRHLITHTLPSTVVTFATTPWKILREGPIEEEVISACVNFLCYSDVEEWT